MSDDDDKPAEKPAELEPCDALAGIRASVDRVCADIEAIAEDLATDDVRGAEDSYARWRADLQTIIAAAELRIARARRTLNRS